MTLYWLDIVQFTLWSLIDGGWNKNGGWKISCNFIAGGGGRNKNILGGKVLKN